MVGLEVGRCPKKTSPEKREGPLKRLRSKLQDKVRKGSCSTSATLTGKSKSNLQKKRQQKKELGL